MIFNINFFLFSFAQSNIWSYTFVYAKYYANVTNAQFGLLAMVLPALALFAKPMCCSLADASAIHRQILIGMLITFGISYGTLGVLPFFKDPSDHGTDMIAWIIISVVMCLGYVATACVFCMNDALASNYARKHNLSYSRMRIWASTGWASGALLVMLVGDISWLPFRVLGIIILVLSVSLDIAFLILWPYPEDFEMFHDGSTVEQRKLSIVGPNTMALMAQNRPRPSIISRDMLEKIRAGRSKSVGHMPRSPEQQMRDAQAMKQKEPEEEPKEYSNFQAQMILIKMIASHHKSFLRFIALFVVFGIVQGAFWTFQMDYVKLRVTKDDAEFEFISTLCMVAQSFFGEILINIVATDMIRLFGTNANMSLALVALGLRCFFYCQILPYVSPYLIVIGEALQGPSTGLYWILIVDIGSNYALMVTDFMPEMKRRGIVRDRFHEEELSGCLRATMIGVMSASMEGLGVAVGALIGGMLTGSMGYDFTWNVFAALAISLGFVNIGWDVLTKLVIKKKSAKDKAMKEMEHLKQARNNFTIPNVVVEDFQVKL